MAIKWIFFDVGFTLVSEEKATIERARLQVCEHDHAGLSVDDILNEMVIVSNEYKNQYKAIMAKYGITDIVHYNSELEEVYPSVYRVLPILKTKYKLGILANQEQGLLGRLERRNLSSFFDIVLASFEEKLHKPDPEFFKKALQIANVLPSECVMVGDRLDNDIQPAKALGFRTVRVKQGYARFQKPINSSYEPDITIESIGQICEAIEALSKQ